MKRLILMVGLPYSGKSTCAMQWVYPIVNPDSIRLAIHGQRFIKEAEPYVWAIAMTMVKSLFLAGHATVVVDATNNTQKRRDFWKSDQWDIQTEIMDTSADECIRRAESAEDTIMIPVIKRMALEADWRR